MSSPPPCDPRVFKEGRSIAVCDCASEPMERWVKMVRKRSKQKVDWHYSGGRANVLFLGDRQKVLAAILGLQSVLEGELRGTLIRVVGEEEVGPYRKGVTPAPDGAIAAWSDSDGEHFFIEQGEPIGSI